MWSDLMSRLDEDSQARLAGVMTGKSFKPGEVLFWEGEAGDALYVIDSGHILVERVTEQGDTVAVAVLGPDSIVGEQALLGDENRGATARVLTPTAVRTLGQAEFGSLRSSHPVFDRLLIGLLDGRIRELNDLVLEARHRPAEDRIKRRLSEMAELFGEEIPLTQATLAALAGTTRPTTNGVLQHLQEEGILALRRGRIAVLDADRL